MRRRRFQSALLIALSGLLFAACSRDESERCVDLRDSIQAYAESLPRYCVIDDDCFVTLVRPDTYVAVSDLPDNAELEAITRAYEAECASPSPPRDVFSARCVTEAADPPDLDATSDAGTGGGLVAGTCTLYVGDEPADLDALEIPDPDSIECTCSSHDECGRAELCMNDCLCLPRCEAACTSVDLCGSRGLTDLGLGTDIDTCAQVCEVNLADEALQEQVRCLSTAACGAHEACLSSP